MTFQTIKFTLLKKLKKMRLIRHRINTIQQLQNCNSSEGIELDLRYHNNEVILHHDPFSKGEKFEDILSEFKLNFIILNIKSEGIEEEVLRLVKKYDVQDYFFRFFYSIYG